MPIDFPDSPTNGDLYSAGGKNWQYNGSAWVLLGVVPSIPVGSVGTSELADNAVTTAKIAAGAVVEADLATGAVTADKIGSSAVTTAKIAAGAVTATELGSSAVTTAKISAGAVTTTEIANSAVTSSKLASSLTLGGSPIFGDSSLSSSANSRNDVSKDFGTTHNADSLFKSLFRESAGSNWETASWLLQRRVDVTNQAFVRFAGSYIALGYASTNYLIADSSGRVYAPHQPYVHAFVGGANFSWGSGTNVIPFNNTTENTGSHFNTANQTFTCPVAGRYLVIATCQLGSETTGSWAYNLGIYKNGSGQIGTYETGVAGRQYNKAHISGVISCAANDTLNVRVLVNQTTNLEGAGDFRNRLFITLL